MRDFEVTTPGRGQWLPSLFLMVFLAASPAIAAPDPESPSNDSTTATAKPADMSPIALPSSTPDHIAEVAEEVVQANTVTDTAVNTTAEKQVNEPAQPLAIQIEALKKQLIKLNRDLFILEEELLFPANTQLSVLLAVDADETFSLDSVKLKIDDEVVTQYLYTDRQIHALKRGGVQRLYMGNLRAGEHELTAVFIGYGPNNREYKRAATLTFDKETGQKTIEVKISASEGSYQPEFSVIES